MPTQEVFFEHNVGDHQVEVLKTYDQHYAKEAFGSMDLNAQELLWHSLKINDAYDVDDLPTEDGAKEDFLWEELLDSAREDGNLRSFFVVNETTASIVNSLYVSPDWPSAEAFAKGLLIG